MMKKTNAKRVLAAALAGMMALSLSACGEQGEAHPRRARPQRLYRRRRKRRQSQRQSHRIPGKTAGRQPETPAARRLCPRRIGRLCRRSLPLEQH